jgi:hypothetical protein
MDCVISARGLLIHVRRDWPCAVCRPWCATESRGFCLCIGCAHYLLHATEAGMETPRELLGDIADALVALEADVLSRGSELN